MALRILINGSKGRMGQALLAAAPDLGLRVSAALDAGDDLALAERTLDAAGWAAPAPGAVRVHGTGRLVERLMVSDEEPLPAVAHQLGITGVVDPGGNNMTPNEYQALFKVWRDGELTVRVAYSLCGMTDGKEFEEYQQYLAMMPQGFGDAEPYRLLTKPELQLLERDLSLEVGVTVGTVDDRLINSRHAVIGPQPRLRLTSQALQRAPA